MTVIRIVPNLPVADVARAGELYRRLFGLEIGMDLGWVANLAPAESPETQLQVLTHDAAAPLSPAISIGLAAPDDVDHLHERVREAGLMVMHPVTDEEWGVRRFLFRDPDGNVVNVVANR